MNYSIIVLSFFNVIAVVALGPWLMGVVGMGVDGMGQLSGTLFRIAFSLFVLAQVVAAGMYFKLRDG